MTDEEHKAKFPAMHIHDDDTNTKPSDEEVDMDELFEQNYQSWREVWDLDQITLRDVYEAGFRHGYDAAQEAK